MEKERNKPQFFLKGPMEPTGAINLNVRVLGQVFARKVKFYIVAIGNHSGFATAEDVQPFVGIAKGWKNAQPIFAAAPSEAKEVNIDWIRPLDEFDNSPQAFARALTLRAVEAITQQPALVHDKLVGGGTTRFFTLFLTIEGSKSVFFIGEGNASFESEEAFQIELRIEAKDVPLTPIATFQVKVNEWNDLSVTMAYASEAVKPPPEA